VPLTLPQAAPPASAQVERPLEGLPRDELAKIYEQVFGKAPHPRAKPETIIERIRSKEG
jgi:hypothetical protein